MYAANHLVVKMLKSCKTTDKEKRIAIVAAQGNYFKHIC